MIFTPQTKATKALSYVITLILFIALITVLGMFGSCKSTEKRQAKMYGKFDKLKRKADADSVLKVVPPKWSLDKFPLTISKGKTTFLPGRTIVKHDTTTKTKIVNDTVYIETEVVKYNNTVDTFVRVDTLLDPRPQAICNAEISRLQTELRQVNDKLIQSKASEQTAKDKLNKRTGIMWWLIAALVVLILWTFRKLIPIFK
jgi:hypothetical protein